MCGIVGISAAGPVNQDIFDTLTVLQHRGQDAAGIMTWYEGKVLLRKGNGLVRDVIRMPHMLRLQGNMGIGHVRYPTAGGPSAEEAQPLYVNSPYGLAIVHNGNLINSESLKAALIEADLRHLNTTSDSEILLNVFAHELRQCAPQGNTKLKPANIFAAVSTVHQRVKGGYASIILIAGQGILGIRDPFAIRPIVLGKRKGQGRDEYMLASESVALDSLGFKLVGDLAPGEAVFIDMKGKCHRQKCAKTGGYSPCIFEQVYLARPDSIIDEILVYKFRLKLGLLLAEKILKENPRHDIDVVIPIPDTSRTSALPLAQKLGVKYREGFIKNRYIGRTFIMPGQAQRRKSVRQKLNAISLEFKDKNVLLVDDSIVRGTTSKEIIQMARDAGAKKVYFASAAPPVRFPNVYGIDMPARDELIAADHSPEEIAKIIGADWLIYQDLQALYQAAAEGNPNITRFDDSVFTGDYVTGPISEHYFKGLAQRRSDKAKQSAAALGQSQTIEIHNG